MGVMSLSFKDMYLFWGGSLFSLDIYTWIVIPGLFPVYISSWQEKFVFLVVKPVNDTTLF